MNSRSLRSVRRRFAKVTRRGDEKEEKTSGVGSPPFLSVYGGEAKTVSGVGEANGLNITSILRFAVSIRRDDGVQIAPCTPVVSAIRNSPFLDAPAGVQPI